MLFFVVFLLLLTSSSIHAVVECIFTANDTSLNGQVTERERHAAKSVAWREESERSFFDDDRIFRWFHVDDSYLRERIDKIVIFPNIKR